MYTGPGIYRHYKGGLYAVIGTATVEHTRGGQDEQTVVVYASLDPPPENLCKLTTRPLDDHDGPSPFNAEWVDNYVAGVPQGLRVERFVQCEASTVARELPTVSVDAHVASMAMMALGHRVDG